MSRSRLEELNDLEKEAIRKQTESARRFAEMEQLSKEIEKVETRMAALGINSIEEAKAKAAEMFALADDHINKVKRLLDEVEG